ncbi:hypothetical protein [Lentilactobacillus kefiri]|uniref:hypothetical protein n=1 Tax=Lentilactobacillus kefiri TaxID=33962 RepID=UPI00345F02BA
MNYTKDFFIEKLSLPPKEHHVETITLQGIKVINVPSIGKKNDDEKPAFSGKTLLRVAKLIEEQPNASKINYKQ